MKNIRVVFLSEKFQFLVIEFSVYLNRRDFVMNLNELCHIDATLSLNASYILCETDNKVHVLSKSH